MGADPKPSKRRRQAASSLPLVPPPSKTPDELPAKSAHVVSSAHQTRIPHGPGYDRAISHPSLVELFERMAGVDDDGYFKLCPGGDGKAWYLSYRWRWGQWAGHYVMAVVGRGDLSYGVILLAEKVLAVQSGALRPTRDRYGD